MQNFTKYSFFLLFISRLTIRSLSEQGFKVMRKQSVEFIKASMKYTAFYNLLLYHITDRHLSAGIDNEFFNVKKVTLRST